MDLIHPQSDESRIYRLLHFIVSFKLVEKVLILFTGQKLFYYHVMFYKNKNMHRSFVKCNRFIFCFRVFSF